MIVISNPIAIANEINTIHALFERGLELLHVRKPEFSAEEMKTFVAAIGLEYRRKLVLHSEHQIAEDLGINRLHFSEKMREQINPETLYHYNEKRIHLSTSIHTIEAFNDLRIFFQYAFLSPVYNSISKENYKSKIDLLNAIQNRTNHQTKLVALGGIESANIQKTLAAGFDNVALLGTIWNTNQPIKNFELCQQIVLS
ncbi:thiamine phosphate synthase [Flavobacterium undicola]|uniref:thiamine phosphate synthase n=1 Tax=Flavobacterium undicola TaxID=1932779 RepID=UPI0013767815|nr:thiamine phosphate synthase [Flavobacterium undicola]MBA0882540.1 thiamine phosphate synthase [Flavobacterium undicola]